MISDNELVKISYGALVDGDTRYNSTEIKTLVSQLFKQRHEYYENRKMLKAKLEMLLSKTAT